FQFALSRPYYTLPEKTAPDGGGLLSITVNPYTCKGCLECVAVCDDDALRPVKQTKDSVNRLKNNWNFWLELPNTPKRFIRVDNLEERIGALETILLNKEVYLSFPSGEGACMGCAEKTVLHLFIATVESLVGPRIESHLAHLDDLITRFEEHIRLKLIEEIDVDDMEAMAEVVNRISDTDLTLANIAGKIEDLRGRQPIDQDWFRRVTQLLSKLKRLKWRYTEGTTGKGRVTMGMVNATGCTSVWGSTYPYNPYPFPWANHLFQDSVSMAMGIFEGHMAKMAEGFKAIRLAELELAGRYNPEEHEGFFKLFGWHQFSDDELLLCPPVVVVGGDGAMYDIGFQNLSRAMMSGKPIKVVVVDTQVYSNTGGQACTSGFLGQVSDMAPFGKVSAGKQEVRKEIGLVAMAHRTTYVMQSTIANANHMIEGFIEGLMTQRPALFNCYTSCQPEHGIGDDASYRQAKLAVESRAYPLFRYNPDRGKTPAECFDLEANPSIDQDWPSYQLTYIDGGREKVMDLPMTFADFAMTEGRFRKHFRKAEPDTWHEDMIPLAEFLNLAEDERNGKWPFIWTINRRQELSRLLVDQTMVESCEDRRNFWVMLRALAGIGKEVSHEDLEAKIKKEVLDRLSAGLMQLASGQAEGLTGAEAVNTLAPAATHVTEAPRTPKVTSEYLAPWIESKDCTGCDECVKLDSNIFAYDENKKAYIKNPQGGPYRNLVKAAERCTAQVIHPGLPKERIEKDTDKWIKRAEKYNQ
ncbi:MAG: thiamine pyrophosphate-dependent enzyme, partial [Pseudomonadota bacterium]